MEENKQGLAVREKVVEAFPVGENNRNGNENHDLIPAKQLPAVKQISNEQLIAEEKFLLEKETEIGKNYEGWRGYLRLFHVSKVIGMLALYLYLDQYDLHHAQHQKQAEARMATAKRLTRLAILGEKFHQTNLAFFHDFILLLRRYFVGGEAKRT